MPLRPLRPTRPRTIAAAVAGVVAAFVGAVAAQSAPAAACPLPAFGPGEAYRPLIRPSDFGPHVTNPYFPLAPGRVLVYTGVKDGERAVDIVLATARTRLVDGVRTRVVEDRLYLDGALEERTSDYYAQDRCGNVWYFGEDTAELDRRGRVVSTEGSFHAGVDGAQPGVFMQARPEVGRVFRQEWLEGHAEDTFSVVSRSSAVTVPAGRFRHALRTRETTALEPGVVDAKRYVKGIGEVSEESVRGPREVMRLVEIIS
jgi:hypothetical protein